MAPADSFSKAITNTRLPPFEGGGCAAPGAGVGLGVGVAVGVPPAAGAVVAGAVVAGAVVAGAVVPVVAGVTVPVVPGAPPDARGPAAATCDPAAPPAAAAPPFPSAGAPPPPDPPPPHPAAASKPAIERTPTVEPTLGLDIPKVRHDLASGCHPQLYRGARA
jgi:hypothetical protein